MARSKSLEEMREKLAVRKGDDEKGQPELPAVSGDAVTPGGKDMSPVIRVTVNDETMTVDVNEALRIENVVADRQEVIARMAFWGSVTAAASQKRDEEDLSFRHWMANSQKAHMDADPKLAQWKTQVAIETTAEFRLMKERIIEADRNYASARVLYDAYRHKAKMIEAMTYMESGLRSSVGGIGDSPDERDPRVGAMEAALSGKQKGG